MRRSILILGLALVAAAVPPASAQTAARKSHSVELNMRLAMINQNPPSGSVYAGEVKGKPLGTAAIIARTQVSGTTSTGKVVIYAKRGTIRANVTNQIQPQPDGSGTFPGSFKVTRGTGLYKGVTGKGSFDGTAAAGSTVIVFHVTGKLRY
jgi:hypothetical protein